MSNDFIGMDCCVYCKEPKAILIHKHFKPIPKCSSSSPEPCDACKHKFEENDVVPLHEVIPVRKGYEPTGRYVFVRRSAIDGEEFVSMMNKVGFLYAIREEFEKIVVSKKEQTC